MEIYGLNWTILMSGNNSQNSNKKHRKKKRKTKSPLSGDDSHCSQTGKTGINVSGTNTSLSCGGNTRTLDYTNSQDNVTSVMNAQINSQMHTSPVMNYGQQNPYVASTPQTPIFFQMSQATPGWAACMMEDVRAIKEALPKIEKIEKVVNSISLKMSEFEAKLASVETRVDTIETSCNFINDSYEKQKSEFKRSQS